MTPLAIAGRLHITLNEVSLDRSNIRELTSVGAREKEKERGGQKKIKDHIIHTQVFPFIYSKVINYT